MKLNQKTRTLKEGSSEAASVAENEAGLSQPTHSRRTSLRMIALSKLQQGLDITDSRTSIEKTVSEESTMGIRASRQAKQNAKARLNYASSRGSASVAGSADEKMLGPVAASFRRKKVPQKVQKAYQFKSQSGHLDQLSEEAVRSDTQIEVKQVKAQKPTKGASKGKRLRCQDENEAHGSLSRASSQDMKAMKPGKRPRAQEFDPAQPRSKNFDSSNPQIQRVPLKVIQPGSSVPSLNMPKRKVSQSLEPQEADYCPGITVQLLDSSPQDLDCDDHASVVRKKNQALHQFKFGDFASRILYNDVHNNSNGALASSKQFPSDAAQSKLSNQSMEPTQREQHAANQQAKGPSGKTVCHFTQVALTKQRVRASFVTQDRNLTKQESQQQKLVDQERHDDQEIELFLKNVPRKLNYELENENQGHNQFTQALSSRSKSPFGAGRGATEEEKECTLLVDQTISEDDDCEDEDEDYEMGSADDALPASDGNFKSASRTQAAMTADKTPLMPGMFNTSPSKEKFYQMTQQMIIARQNANPTIYKTGPTKYQDGANKGHWTAKEDEQLTKAVEKYNSKNWKKIAESLQGRTDVQCLHRWQKVLNPQLVKGPWSKDEDKLVLSLVQTNGAQKWTHIAHYLPGRIGKQCRERWHNHLNPRIKKNEWSLEEELILFIQNRMKQNKWAIIAKDLEGRTDNTIKNHWNSSMKKKIFDMKQYIEKKFKKRCEEIKVKYVGCFPEPGHTFSASYKHHFDQFLDDMLQKLVKAVNEQNSEYFKQKAHDLIADKDPDGLNYEAGKMLIESLGLKVEDFLPASQQQRRGHVSERSTAAQPTSVQRVGSVNRSHVQVSSWTIKKEKQSVESAKNSSAFQSHFAGSSASQKQHHQFVEHLSQKMGPTAGGSMEEKVRKGSNVTILRRGRPPKAQQQAPAFNQAQQAEPLKVEILKTQEKRLEGVIAQKPTMIISPTEQEQQQQQQLSVLPHIQKGSEMVTDGSYHQRGNGSGLKGNPIVNLQIAHSNDNYCTLPSNFYDYHHYSNLVPGLEDHQSGYPYQTNHQMHPSDNHHSLILQQSLPYRHSLSVQDVGPQPNIVLNDVAVDCHDFNRPSYTLGNNQFFGNSVEARPRRSSFATPRVKQGESNSKSSQKQNSGKANNQMGDNPTVEHTSPEMLRCFSKPKNTNSSGCQPTKDQNYCQLENGIVNQMTPQGDKTKLSKQSGQNSISAFKPYGISNSPIDPLHANGGTGQHNHHHEVSQFQPYISHSAQEVDSLHLGYQFSQTNPHNGGQRFFNHQQGLYHHNNAQHFIRNIGYGPFVQNQTSLQQILHQGPGVMLSKETILGPAIRHSNIASLMDVPLTSAQRIRDGPAMTAAAAAAKNQQNRMLQLQNLSSSQLAMARLAQRDSVPLSKPSSNYNGQLTEFNSGSKQHVHQDSSLQQFNPTILVHQQQPVYHMQHQQLPALPLKQNVSICRQNEQSQETDQEMLSDHHHNNENPASPPHKQSSSEKPPICKFFNSVGKKSSPNSFESLE